MGHPVRHMHLALCAASDDLFKYREAPKIESDGSSIGPLLLVTASHAIVLGIVKHECDLTQYQHGVSLEEMSPIKMEQLSFCGQQQEVLSHQLSGCEKRNERVSKSFFIIQTQDKNQKSSKSNEQRWRMNFGKPCIVTKQSGGSRSKGKATNMSLTPDQ
jgi:hypothetical protein